MLHAQGRQLVVSPIKKETAKDKIQFVVIEENKQTDLCKVESVGNKVENVNVKEGDTVYIQTNTAIKLVLEGGKEVMILHEDGVLAKLD